MTAITRYILIFSGLFISFSFRGNELEHQLKTDGFVLIPGSENTSYVNPVIRKGFYISATEISNEQYNLFLADLLAREQIRDYNIAKIDSTRWTDFSIEMTPYQYYYHLHPAYAKYPVVNISFEGAELYCKWLTEKYHALGVKGIVRMPQEDEWSYAASGGNPENIYAWEGNSLHNKKNNLNGNFNFTGPENSESIIMAPVKSFGKNKFGLYNMSGNVAEMLDQTGTHKGGSWDCTEVFISIAAEDIYAGLNGASPFIGFRPVLIME